MNSRLAVATHVLTLLAYEQRALTSNDIAASVNTNPVAIRRALGALRAARLVRSQPGPGGGWQLLRAPDAITLRDVQRIVDAGLPFRTHDEPNRRCPIGRRIAPALQGTFERAQQALEKELARTTIAGMLRRLMQS